MARSSTQDGQGDVPSGKEAQSVQARLTSVTDTCHIL